MTDLINSSKLAIVIPFYKAAHFRKLLESLANQIDNRFIVYVGDDDSPDSATEILEDFYSLLNIRYFRFSSRLGHISLSQHWDRCVSLINSKEEWVWVLPDDDFPSENCVAEFYKHLDEAGVQNVKAFRFPIDIINSDDIYIAKNQENNPDFEFGYQYFERAMRSEILTSLGDIIFNRKALQNSGGFVDFLQAWGSDQATVIRATHKGVIRTLHEGRLNFRMSGKNISSQKNDGIQKVTARIDFAKWIIDNNECFSHTNLSILLRNFSKKQDAYLVNVWDLNYVLLWKYYRFKVICTGSYNPIPLLFILFNRFIKRVV